LGRGQRFRICHSRVCPKVESEREFEAVHRFEIHEHEVLGALARWPYLKSRVASRIQARVTAHLFFELHLVLGRYIGREIDEVKTGVAVLEVQTLYEAMKLDSADGSLARHKGFEGMQNVRIETDTAFDNGFRIACLTLEAQTRDAIYSIPDDRMQPERSRDGDRKHDPRQRAPMARDGTRFVRACNSIASCRVDHTFPTRVLRHGVIVIAGLKKGWLVRCLYFSTAPRWRDVVRPALNRANEKLVFVNELVAEHLTVVILPALGFQPLPFPVVEPLYDCIEHQCHARTGAASVASNDGAGADPTAPTPPLDTVMEHRWAAIATRKRRLS